MTVFLGRTRRDAKAALGLICCIRVSSNDIPDIHLVEIVPVHSRKIFGHKKGRFCTRRSHTSAPWNHLLCSHNICSMYCKSLLFLVFCLFLSSNSCLKQKNGFSLELFPCLFYISLKYRHIIISVVISITRLSGSSYVAFVSSLPKKGVRCFAVLISENQERHQSSDILLLDKAEEER